jgi:hypothetical protein
LREASRYPAFEQVLGSILFLAEPLSIDALVELLQLASDKIRLALRGGLSVLMIPDHDSDYIRPYHASLRDFFVDPFRAKDHFLDPLKYNLSLMDSCVELLYEGLANDVQGRESLHYACRYWCRHWRSVISYMGGVDCVKSDLKARTIDLVKNLQSLWLKNWMSNLGYELHMDAVHKDLLFIVTQFEVYQLSTERNQN